MNGYASSVKDFLADYRSGSVIEKIERFHKEAGVFGSRAELRSWAKTVENLYILLTSHTFNQDAYLLLEYKLPLSFRRVDVMFLGKDKANLPTVVITEVKMWNEVKGTDLPGIVQTFVGSTERLVSHPSYQVSAYASTMENILTSLTKMKVLPCAWMNNAKKKTMSALLLPCYKEWVDRAPVYFNEDHQKLEDMINRATCNGGGQKVLDFLVNSPIKPGKKLAGSVASMLLGNEEFLLQENQKLVYETILDETRKNKKSNKKHVYIVAGGPGTGKSVLAINLFAAMTKSKLSACYVAPNSSFRAIIRSKVTKKTHKETADLITGSAVYADLKENALDCVIVDEAHRLKDGRARGYRGVNQIQDVISAAKVSVFFVDEFQTIRPEDIGYINGIVKVANQKKAAVHVEGIYRLATQLRYPGSEDYLKWVEQTLQLTDEKKPQSFTSEFKIVDSPHEMMLDMKKRIAQGYTARFLAGKAWDWSNKINPDKEALVDDVSIEEHGFAMPWSMPKTPELWAVSDWGQFQVGSVHSAQGAEFDYAYVLIGTDLVFKDGKVVADPKNSTDLIAKRGYKQDPATFDRLIKQTYRILLTRGMRGNMVFIRDPKLRAHFKDMYQKQLSGGL